MLCPTDKTLLLRNDSDKPLHQCSDCSGIFISLPATAADTGSILDAPMSALRCPRDGSRLHVSNTAEVDIHMCAKCGSAWLDGEAQERLMSKFPNGFGKSRPATAGSIAAGIAINAIFAIIGT